MHVGEGFLKKAAATIPAALSMAVVGVSLAGCVVEPAPPPRHVAYYASAPAVVVVHPRPYYYHERVFVR